MNKWEEDKKEDFWHNQGPRVNNMYEEDRKTQCDVNELKQYSCRTTKHVPVASNSPAQKSYQKATILSYTLTPESDLQSPELMCYSCKHIIGDQDLCLYEGNKVFTNETCWQHWIDVMTDSADIRIDELLSLASKRYCLERVTKKCNGQLTLKVTLALKAVMNEYEFGVLLFDNDMACNHYMAFLKETRQTDYKTLRFKYQIEEVMAELRALFSDNARVNEKTVQQFIMLLTQFRNERLLTLNMPLQCEMIMEYKDLLEFQLKTNKEFINSPLIETLMSNNVSYSAIKDLEKARYLKKTFKLTAEEFVWTSLKSIVDDNKVNEIDNVVNHKVMGNKPDVTFQRIVAYLVFLNKEPDEIKMKCLSKIPDIHDLVDCANMWKLLPVYADYCKQKGDNSQLKKIQQAYQNVKK